MGDYDERIRPLPWNRLRIVDAQGERIGTRFINWVKPQRKFIIYLILRK